MRFHIYRKMAASTPYLGSKISLISNAEIRYEGILYTIDSKESTVALFKGKLFVPHYRFGLLFRKRNKLRRHKVVLLGFLNVYLSLVS